MTETLPPDTLAAAVDRLIKGPQYDLSQAAKDRRLLPIMQGLATDMMARCGPYDRFIRRLGTEPSQWQSLVEVPPLPVAMFKHHQLRAVPEQLVVRELHSSSTTSGKPSRIYLDKTTAFRQSKALTAVLKEHLGRTRRPYLVLDTESAAAAGDSLVARGAAIRGIGLFASETVYGFEAQSSGLVAQFDAIDRFFAEHRAEQVLLFGFTYMIWQHFVRPALADGRSFSAAQAIVLHSGGWKKLTDQQVGKQEFSERVAEVIGCPQESVIDFYGMVEQVGTVFVDCAAGNKHAPAFADVILRRPGDLQPVSPGQVGIIEVLSVLPTSYPALVLLTEDQGRLLGHDDCPCGRKGRYFRFVSRVERAPIRGCGDVFAAAEKQGTAP